MNKKWVRSMSGIVVAGTCWATPGCEVEAATSSWQLVSTDRLGTVDLSTLRIETQEKDFTSFRYQKVETLAVTSNTLTFQHFISTSTSLKTLTYQLLNQEGEVLQEVKVRPVKGNDYLQAKVQFSLEGLLEEPLLKLQVVSKQGTQDVQDFDQKVTTLSDATATFRPVFEGQSVQLLNRSIEHVTYQQHQFFGETLHLAIQEDIGLTHYQLQLVETSTIQAFPFYKEANQGLPLVALEPGTYQIKLNGMPILSESEVFEVWHTVQREGKANQVTLYASSGQLFLKVESVTQLPENVYDLLIDPGHGGIDSGAVGNGTTEAKEVLKVSQYLAQRFEDHGLKVKLTRTENVEPAIDDDCDYLACPYLEEGRVEQVYRYRPNYVISNHLNYADGKAQGFEVYSSMATTDHWTQEVVKAFKALGREPRDNQKSPYWISEGSYQRSYLCDAEDGCLKAYADYYYMLRETGGRLTQSSRLLQNNPVYKDYPTYGAEALLIEYIFLDHARDYQIWANSWKAHGEAVVEGTLTYLGIPYVAPNHSKIEH